MWKCRVEIQIIGNDFFGVIFSFNYRNAICEKKAKCPNDIFKKVFRYVKGITHFYFLGELLCI